MTSKTDKPNLSVVPDTPAPAPGPSRAERRKAAAEARKATGSDPETPKQIEPRRVLVIYVYDDAEGFERHDRMWITGIADLRTLDGVLSTEKVIEEQKKQPNVRIINWKPLEA